MKRAELILNLTCAISNLKERERGHLEWSRSETFPGLRDKCLHQADISRRAWQRLERKLNRIVRQWSETIKEVA